MTKVLIKRGTRSQLNAAASANQLNQGEPYLIIDENRLAVGLSSSTFAELPKLSEVSASGTGTATIDFGLGSNEAQVTVSGLSSIQSDSNIRLSVSASSSSSSHTANDHKYFMEFCSLTASAPVASTGFTIYARSIHKLTGTWTITWHWN